MATFVIVFKKKNRLDVSFTYSKHQTYILFMEALLCI